HADLRLTHSFPTRRSSDLSWAAWVFHLTGRRTKSKPASRVRAKYSSCTVNPQSPSFGGSSILPKLIPRRRVAGRLGVAVGSGVGGSVGGGVRVGGMGVSVGVFVGGTGVAVTEAQAERARTRETSIRWMSNRIYPHYSAGSTSARMVQLQFIRQTQFSSSHTQVSFKSLRPA